MRVLGCLAGVIAALAITNACYDPSLKDCQFKCGPGSACPDGTTCSGMYCRTSGATGMCPVGSGIDAPGSGSNCPAAPPPNCSSGTQTFIDSLCWIECTPQIQPALAFATICGADTGARQSWFAAIIDTQVLRDHLADPFKDGGPGWIGLVRDPAGSNWHWTNPTSEPQTGTQGVNGWDNNSPQSGQNFATYDPNSATYISGSDTDQHNVFCEARP